MQKSFYQSLCKSFRNLIENSPPYISLSVLCILLLDLIIFVAQSFAASSITSFALYIFLAVIVIIMAVMILLLVLRQNSEEA